MVCDVSSLSIVLCELTKAGWALLLQTGVANVLQHEQQAVSVV